MMEIFFMVFTAAMCVAIYNEVAKKKVTQRYFMVTYMVQYYNCMQYNNVSFVWEGASHPGAKYMRRLAARCQVEAGYNGVTAEDIKLYHIKEFDNAKDYENYCL